MDFGTCRYRIYNSHPFFGSILFNTEISFVPKETLSIPTMGTDGESIFVVKEFWDSLPDMHKFTVLLHEVGHMIFLHPFRKGIRDHMIWNLATDFAVNALIIAEFENKRDIMPAGVLYDKKYEGMSAEKIYDDLLKNAKKMNGKTLDSHDKWGDGEDSKKEDGNGKGKETSAEEKEARMKGLIEIAAQHHIQKQGSLSAGLDRMYKMSKPKEDWRALLRDYASPYDDDYTFSRPDRRFLEQEFILPNLDEQEKIDWIAIVFDTSGSISLEQLSQFLAEFREIFASFDKVVARFSCCDADATEFVELTEFDEKKIKIVGGGGTSFIPPFEKIKKFQTVPKALFYFTDLAGDFPERAPMDYDVVWVTDIVGGHAPFGKVLYL